MKIINSSYEILTPLNEMEVLKRLEIAGRVCYKSEDKITDESCLSFVNLIKSKNHLSVIEHVSMTVKFVCDRGVSHELVRHRLASFSQESTRYCNYSKGKFDSEITVVRPANVNPASMAYGFWLLACKHAEEAYMDLLKADWSPQQARSVLPNSLKTEIVVTANLREWLHILDLRCSKAAHPDMRALMIPLQEELARTLPSLFKTEET